MLPNRQHLDRVFAAKTTGKMDREKCALRSTRAALHWERKWFNSIRKFLKLLPILHFYWVISSGVSCNKISRELSSGESWEIIAQALSIKINHIFFFSKEKTNCSIGIRYQSSRDFNEEISHYRDCILQTTDGLNFKRERLHKAGTIRKVRSSPGVREGRAVVFPLFHR